MRICGRGAPSSAPVCALGHLSLSPLSLRDIIPTPFGLRPFPPDRGNRPLDKGSRPPVGGRLWGRSNMEGFVLLWDVWIHILEIGAECACWKAGGPVCRPTREVVGTCPLIRPLRGHLPPRGKAYEQPGAPPLRRIVGEKRRAHSVRPYKRGGGNLPPHPPPPGAPSPQGEGLRAARCAAHTAYLRTALHIKRGTGLGPVP